MPFYSFCLTAGIDAKTQLGNVHVYDAIGSHERVAVGAVGSGREMLQPMLDRLFSTSNLLEETASHQTAEIQVGKQRKGLLLTPPVRTFVESEVDEAVEFIVRGFKSVAERDINVGDEVIVCVIKTDLNDEAETDYSSKGKVAVIKFPLKNH